MRQNRVVATIDTVDGVVDQLKQQGVDAYWDGWELKLWVENPNGFNDRNGAYRNDKWGILRSISLNDAAEWVIPVGRLGVALSA